MRVDGLFGWVEHNNTRSIALILGFALMMQPLAAITLFLPLTYADPAHTPWYHWTAYALRYVPAVTLVAIASFALQMWWHLKTVRKTMSFRFVDDADEPRLCSLVEPLAIAAGIPTPYVGIVDSPARNAFACGVTRNSSVVVFTRGIVDGLDDDELSSVIAHELIHIRNGDARLVAAANAFLRNMALLDRFSGWRPKRYRQVASLLFLPVLFPAYLGAALLSQLCLRLGVASRLLISSAREFIADAEAVRLTQNPAALVSALRRIQGHSAIRGLPFEQDAMMIDGIAQGRLATHPPIMDRIQAIVATTGQMALDGRPRQDTRHASTLRPGGFGPDGLGPNGFGNDGVDWNMLALQRVAAAGYAPQAGGLRAFLGATEDGMILGLRWDLATAMLATFLAAMAVHGGHMSGMLGHTGQLLAAPEGLALLQEKAKACNGAAWQVLLGHKAPAQACDPLEAAFASRAKAFGINVTQDGRMLSASQIAMLSPDELEPSKAGQTLGTGGFIIPVFANKLPPGSQDTDLMPSYALPLHEAWQRLSTGSIAPLIRTLQCGILVHAHPSAVPDQSVTWSITSESVEQLRFTATLLADGPDKTRVSLAITDYQAKTMMSDSRSPNAPPFSVTMRPALSLPLRPYFAEAMNAMLEGRQFRANNVVALPTTDRGAQDTANICASQRTRLAMGTRFSIHDKAFGP